MCLLLYDFFACLLACLPACFFFAFFFNTSGRFFVFPSPLLHTSYPFSSISWARARRTTVLFVFYNVFFFFSLRFVFSSFHKCSLNCAVFIVIFFGFCFGRLFFRLLPITSRLFDWCSYCCCCCRSNPSYDDNIFQLYCCCSLSRSLFLSFSVCLPLLYTTFFIGV